MFSVHVYLFHLMVMIGMVEPGKVFQKSLCSGEDLKIQVNHTAVVVYVVYNGVDIAKSSNVSSMKWDKHLPEYYEGRLSFNIERFITITLKNASHNDTGLCRIVTKSSKGIRQQRDWNVTVLVPPSVDEKISISDKRVNDSCFNLTCGKFLSLGKPEVHFNWTVSASKEQSVISCDYTQCQCHVVGPATKCLTTNLSASKEFCISNAKHRRRRSVDDKQCVWAHTEKHGPKNPVPIVLGVLAVVIAIAAVITVIIVFDKRRSRNQRVPGPTVQYMSTPMEENKKRIVEDHSNALVTHALNNEA